MTAIQLATLREQKSIKIRMHKIDVVIKNKYREPDNVNNVDVSNDNNKYSNNVDNDIEIKLKELMSLMGEKKNKPKAVAEAISKKLGDESKNLNFHIKTAKTYEAGVLFECLSIALDAQRKGRVRSLPKYYVGILKKKGLVPFTKYGKA